MTSAAAAVPRLPLKPPPFQDFHSRLPTSSLQCGSVLKIRIQFCAFTAYVYERIILAFTFREINFISRLSQVSSAASNLLVSLCSSSVSHLAELTPETEPSSCPRSSRLDSRDKYFLIPRLTSSIFIFGDIFPQLLPYGSPFLKVSCSCHFRRGGQFSGQGSFRGRRHL
jgi:hypothetical protein